MKTQRVTVIDGPLPPGIWQRSDMEPHLVTEPEHLPVLQELMEREPLFHRSGFGTARKDFEKMTAAEFWEVSASGRRFSREFVIGYPSIEIRTPDRGCLGDRRFSLS
jgi:hypothetical protein